MPWNFEDTVDSLDGVPEEYRPGYTAGQDGKFTWKPEFKPFAAAITGNIGVTNKVRADLKKSNDESAARRLAIKAYEDLISASGLTVEEGKSAVEVLKAHIDDLQAKAKNGGELKVNLDALRKDFEKQTKAIREESEGKVTKMTRTLEKHLIGDVSKSALAKFEGNSTLLMPAIRDRVKVVPEGDDYVVRVVDGEGNYRLDTKGGYMTIESLVQELKANPDYAQAFKSTANGGSGARQQTKQTTVSTTPTRDKMSATDKIKAGLGKGQFERGRAEA